MYIAYQVVKCLTTNVFFIKQWLTTNDTNKRQMYAGKCNTKTVVFYKFILYSAMTLV